MRNENDAILPQNLYHHQTTQLLTKSSKFLKKVYEQETSLHDMLTKLLRDFQRYWPQTKKGT